MRTTRCISIKSLSERLSPEQQKIAHQRIVYKFYHASDEKFIVDQGSILIGTHKKYRTIENQSLVDRSEGEQIDVVTSISLRAGQRLDQAAHPYGAFYNWALPMTGPVIQADMSIENIEFFATLDFYVYCFSYECSSSVVESFSAEPFDRVAIIYDIYGLAETLVQFHPKLKGMHYVVSPAIYCNKIRAPTEHHYHPIHTAFEKPESYIGNNEGRIVFFEHHPDGFFYDRNLAVPEPFADPVIKQWFGRGQMP